MDEELRTARAVLDVLVSQAEQGEAALTKLAAKLDDEGLALACVAQAKALRLAADEASKLVELIRGRPTRPNP